MIYILINVHLSTYWKDGLLREIWHLEHWEPPGGTNLSCQVHHKEKELKGRNLSFRALIRSFLGILTMKTDNLTAAQRSRVMQRVRSKDTQPELLVRRYLHAAGFRFRLHDAKLPGSPDVVLPRYRTVVFVQGCFWHSHGTGCSRKSREAPKTNVGFWKAKLAVNQARDQRIQHQLRELGWQVLIVWECELKKSVLGAALHRLTRDITAADELVLDTESIIL